MWQRWMAAFLRSKGQILWDVTVNTAYVHPLNFLTPGSRDMFDSPISQLSILLLLDYGWYSRLGLRCGRSRCVLVWVLGVFFLDVFLAGASHLVTCEHLPREDAIWPLTRVTCRTG
jgi:hypothetical protein